MPHTSNTFSQFELNDELFQAVTDLGYETPTPVQVATIPLMLKGHDVIGLASTGTGKTAAFALPILQRIDASERHPQVLIQAPTRELAQQVGQAFKDFGKYLPKIKVAIIYGGDSYVKQIKNLKDGAQIVVGTPGRTLDHIGRGTLKLDKISHFVLDEADEMLRMGFIDDIESIMSNIPAEAQKALFSATMPKPIHKIARTYLRDPKDIAIKSEHENRDNIAQHYCVAPSHIKLKLLNQFVASVDYQRVIVFVRTKAFAEEVTTFLQAGKHPALAIHGDMQQAARKKTIERFKSGEAKILCATDVAARGLDIEHVDWVINLDMPYDLETYTHRIGRTGRAGRTGSSLCMLTPKEKFFLRLIKEQFKSEPKEYRFPTAEEINEARVQQFGTDILAILETASPKEQKLFAPIIERVLKESDAEPAQVAVAVAIMLNRKSPLLMPPDRTDYNQSQSRSDYSDRPRREGSSGGQRRDGKKSYGGGNKSSFGDYKGPRRESRSSDSRSSDSDRPPRREYKESAGSYNKGPRRESSSTNSDSRPPRREYKTSSSSAGRSEYKGPRREGSSTSGDSKPPRREYKTSSSTAGKSEYKGPRREGSSTSGDSKPPRREYKTSSSPAGKSEYKGPRREGRSAPAGAAKGPRGKKPGYQGSSSKGR